MKAYQLSKINGYYWWTGTSIVTTIPEENSEYKWTSDLKVVKQLNGKNMKVYVVYQENGKKYESICSLSRKWIWWFRSC